MREDATIGEGKTIGLLAARGRPVLIAIVVLGTYYMLQRPNRPFLVSAAIRTAVSPFVGVRVLAIATGTGPPEYGVVLAVAWYAPVGLAVGAFVGTAIATWFVPPSKRRIGALPRRGPGIRCGGREPGRGLFLRLARRSRPTDAEAHERMLGGRPAHCSGRGPAPFTTDNRLWMTYHWLQFHAQGPTTTLTVSDWATPDAPGGPVGQEVMYSFVEVQPVLERP